MGAPEIPTGATAPKRGATRRRAAAGYDEEMSPGPGGRPLMRGCRTPSTERAE